MVRFKWWLETETFCTKKLNKMIRTTLYNQKLLHEKYENLKVDSDTTKRKTATPWLTEQTLTFA